MFPRRAILTTMRRISSDVCECSRASTFGLQAERARERSEVGNSTHTRELGRALEDAERQLDELKRQAVRFLPPGMGVAVSQSTRETPFCCFVEKDFWGSVLSKCVFFYLPQIASCRPMSWERKHRLHLVCWKLT